MACIYKEPVNDYNFIRWHEADSFTLSDLANPLTYCTATNVELPNNIVQYQRHYHPVIIDGQTISFYCNSQEILTDNDFDDWILGVYDVWGNEAVADVTSILEDSFSGGFRFYVPSLTLNNLTPGPYRFVIYKADDSVKYISNCFKFKQATDITKYCYLEYRHSNVVFDFNYTDLSTFKNRIFVDLNNIENQPEIELDPYPEITTGKVRNSKSYTKKAITLEAHYFDEKAHNAMLALSIHDTISINNVDYEVKEPYQTIPSRGNSLKKGIIVMYDQRVSTINLNGYDN